MLSNAYSFIHIVQTDQRKQKGMEQLKENYKSFSVG